jgi:hypothetical protein
VERFNSTLKNFIQTASLSHGLSGLKSALPSFLLDYRASIHPSTGFAPCLMLHNRMVRTKLHPFSSFKANKDKPGEKKKVRFENDINPLKPGDAVRVKHPRYKKILNGLTVKEIVGPRTVILSDGTKWNVSFLARDYLRNGNFSGVSSDIELHDFPEKDFDQTEETEQDEGNTRRSSRVSKLNRRSDFNYY